jgi:hypothetical protein
MGKCWGFAEPTVAGWGRINVHWNSEGGKALAQAHHKPTSNQHGLASGSRLQAARRQYQYRAQDDESSSPPPNARRSGRAMKVQQFWLQFK